MNKLEKWEKTVKRETVVPLIVEDEEGKIVEITTVVGISGGRNQLYNMPKEIIVLKKTRDGEETLASYIFHEIKDRDITRED